MWNLPGNPPFLQSVFHSWWYSTIYLVNLPEHFPKKIERDAPRPGECYPCTSVPMVGWDTMDWAKAAGLGHLTDNPLPILLNSPFQWESRPLSAQQTKPVHLCSKRRPQVWPSDKQRYWDNQVVVGANRKLTVVFIFSDEGYVSDVRP